eukprot:198117-Hanusia_phi.AAC.1
MTGEQVKLLLQFEGQLCQSDLLFVYLRLPLLQSVLPSIGIIERSGQVATVIGEGFYGSAASFYCSFGLGHVVRAASLSSSMAVCTVPFVQQAGLVQLTCSQYEHYRDKQPSLHYLFVDVGGINAIFPTTGPTRGGSVVSVFGLKEHGISLIHRCQFGKEEVKGSFVGRSTLICESPKRFEAGKVSLSVTAEGRKVEGAKYFEYFHAPAIISVTPCIVGKGGGQ